jgi:hypothetical protein
MTAAIVWCWLVKRHPLRSGSAPDAEAQLVRERIEAPCKQQEIYRDFCSRKLKGQNHGSAGILSISPWSRIAAITITSSHLASPRTKPGAVNRAGLLNTLLRDALLSMNPVTLSNRFCVSAKFVSEASSCIIPKTADCTAAANKIHATGSSLGAVCPRS